MKRNKNVDILRDGAILVIILYHAYVLCGTPWVNHGLLHTLLNFCGEAGVTLFFALSGFGIYMSLDRKRETTGLPTWKNFMISRCKRILPQYYFCIFVLLLFPSAHLLSVSGLKHIGAYGLLIQNLFVDTHGSINGALWTMATIFQFYLIAIWLYKGVHKNLFLSMAVSIAITIGSKYVVYTYLIPASGLDVSAYFVYGRQLICALDNFVLGMAAAKIIKSKWLEEKSKAFLYSAGGLLTAGSTAGLLAVMYTLSLKGIYGSSLQGYFGHTAMAVLFMLLIIGVSMLPQINGKMAVVVGFLAKYQYGMYLWHMPVIVSLYNSSQAFHELALRNFSLFATALIVVIIGIGYITSKGIDSAFAGK